MTTDLTPLKPYSREWLLSERPTSRKQARLGRAYVIWRRFSENRLALAGLGIILASSRMRGSMDGVIVGILAIGLVGLALNRLLAFASHNAFKWRGTPA